MSATDNPFPVDDIARHAIWDMLVPRDIAAFLAQDWSMVQDDFAADRFMGVHGHFLSNPDGWRLDFPSLDAYRDEWLRQAAESAATRYAEDLPSALFRVMQLRDIDVAGERALAHKKFDGRIRRADGTLDTLDWQTLYHCALIDGRWKLTGFTGYIAYPIR